MQRECTTEHTHTQQTAEKCNDESERDNKSGYSAIPLLLLQR